MASRSPSPAPGASASTNMDNAPNIQDREDSKGDNIRDTKGSRSRSRSYTPPRKGSRSPSRHSRSRSQGRNSRSHSRSFTPRSNRSDSRSRSRSRGRSMTRSMSRSRSPSRDIKRRDTRSPSPIVSLDSTVKITRLTMNVKEDHIREIFSPYGKIKYINFPVDPRFRLNMGFADVEYETREEAVLAIEGWNGGQLDGEFLVVTFSTKIDRHPVRALDDRPGRRGASPNRRERRTSPPRRPLSPARRRMEDRYAPARRDDHGYSGRRNLSPPPPARRGNRSPPPRRGNPSPPPRRGFSPPRRPSPPPPRRGLRGVNAAPLGRRGGAGAGAEVEDSEVAALVPAAAALVAVEDPQVDPEEEDVEVGVAV
ncbi:RNA-binding protein with serine-rich domain 1 [Podila clonocystis]|nr:RNA-binding protein with serine-rich domain 1 [Podila clonocystis]